VHRLPPSNLRTVPASSHPHAMPPGRTTAYEKLLSRSPKRRAFAEVSGFLRTGPPKPERLAAQVNPPLRTSASARLLLRYSCQCLTLLASSTERLTPRQTHRD
jgi:hypothetical protein